MPVSERPGQVRSDWSANGAGMRASLQSGSGPEIDLTFTRPNIVIILMAWGFEAWQVRKRQSTKIILYEKIENIKPENRAVLIADLEERTGLKVLDIEIGHIDFLRDVAYIKVTYPLEAGKIHNSIDLITKFK